MKIHLKKDMEIILKKILTAEQTPLHLCPGTENVDRDVIKNVTEPTDWITAVMFMKKTNPDVERETDKPSAEDKASGTTPLSEPERQLLVPYSTKANAFCELGRKKIGKNEPCSPQKAFAFVEYGTRSCLSGSDRGVVKIQRLVQNHG